ncbi:hypothetical protein [Asanoa siamensis]|uniref:SUKH-3 immunity protein of toxin-antitoxin system n=1 Tax=Asanoa siamensis TaxID=926357 RepID=A0ABQ4CNF0_9ACTN|nr:hypothetical protein [Asanoa siamensis]GIF72352.1 hypothetical protein Asi02nite_18700 [Asanoa siamensis]
MTPLTEAVGLFATREAGWDPAELSAELSRTGWSVFREVPTPYPSWLAKDGLRLAILAGYEGLGRVAVQVAIKEWAGDWSAPESSSEYVRAVLSGYPAQIDEARRVGRDLIAALSAHHVVEPAAYARADETFAFVFAESWRIGRALLILGVEHLDPDDTPIELNLYVRPA